MNLSAKLTILFFCAFILASFQRSILAINSVSVNPFSNHDGSMLLAKRTTRKKKRRKKKNKSPKTNKTKEKKSKTTAENLPKDFIPRRVLVIDFYNQTANQKTAYLSMSISDAFVGPLQKTKRFEVLARDQSSRAVKELQLSASDTYKEGNATRLGKHTGAEVVLIGSFVTVGDSVNIQAKAVDTESGRVKISDSISSPLNATIFDNINILAKRMSARMASELPPLKQHTLVVVKEKIVIHEKENKREDAKKTKPATTKTQALATSNLFYLAFGLPIVQPLYSTSGSLSNASGLPLDKLSSGFQLSLGYWHTLGFGNWLLGGTMSFSSLKGPVPVVGTNNVILKNADNLQSSEFSGRVLAGYQMFFTTNFSMTVLSGGSFGYFSLKGDTGSIVNGMVLGPVVGTQFNYDIASVRVMLMYTGVLNFMAESKMVLEHGVQLGVGVRL